MQSSYANADITVITNDYAMTRTKKTRQNRFSKALDFQEFQLSVISRILDCLASRFRQLNFIDQSQLRFNAKSLSDW